MPALHSRPVPNPYEKSKSTRRQFLRRASWGIGGAIASGGAWAHYVETDWIEVTRHSVKLPHLPRAFDGFRIAQISDIHLEDGDMTRDLPHICALVTACKADAIVVTGDFVTVANQADGKALARGLAPLRAPQGVFGIMGNHDYWGAEGSQWMEQMLAPTPVRLLINQTHVWERNGARLHLAGYDDFWHGHADFDGVSARVPANEAAIALGHEPDFAIEVAALQKFGLMLSGHSHGGQIALPGGIPIHVPDYARKFPRGWYDVNGLRLYTNRGLGTVGIPMRFCSRPEIAVFTLRA